MPTLDVDRVVPPKGPGPSEGLRTDEIIEYLSAAGRLITPEHPIIAEAIDAVAATSTLPRRVLTNCYRAVADYFSKEALLAQVALSVGPEALDGWRPLSGPAGAGHLVKAGGPRMLHILAGNAPMVAATTITCGALVRGWHVLKMPSNDLFSATALLRVLAEVDPQHPVLSSFTAVNWTGGVSEIESALIRAQYFDKIAAWGGAPTIENITRYLTPGLELVAFDPKSSISLIGGEVFASDETLREAAQRSAIDVTAFQQDSCSASRFQFVEGAPDDVDRYCEYLAVELGCEREFADSAGRPPDRELRDRVDMLRLLDPDYRVWGAYDGRGLVIRSPEPVDFHPERRTVNVIPVSSLSQAVPYVNSATSTVGIFPRERKADLREALAAAGAQRICTCGDMNRHVVGVPHDGLVVLSRFARWVVEIDDDCPAESKKSSSRSIR